jgi:hypothetical protein
MARNVRGLPGVIALVAALAPVPAWAEPGEGATLSIDTEPGAHVYVRGPESGRLAGLCTGGGKVCDLQLASGTYRLAAGFHHAHLAEAPLVLRLEPGARSNVHVDVRANALVDGLGLGAILLEVTSMTIALGAYAEQGFPSQVRVTPTIIGAAVGAGVGIVGLLSAWAMDRPVVEARLWTVPFKEDGT